LLSFTFSDILVDKGIVGETSKLVFRTTVENLRGNPVMILNLVGDVNVGVALGSIATPLGACTTRAPKMVSAPKGQKTSLKITLDMPWTRVNAIQKLRGDSVELYFTINLRGVCAEVRRSSGGWELSYLEEISGNVKMMLRDKTEEYIVITRDQWAKVLYDLKYGEIKIIELPLLPIPEPQLEMLRSSVEAIKSSLNALRRNDPIGCVTKARNAIDIITVPPVKEGEKRRIKKELKERIIEGTPEVLKSHINDVLDRVDDIAGKSFNFITKFVKVQLPPEAPYYPPTNTDLEISISLASDVVRYVINLINEAVEMKSK